MKKNKLLFVLPNFLAGGAERVTINIIRQIDKNLFDISLLVIKSQGEYKNLIPEYVEIIDLNKSKTVYSFVPFFKAIRRIKPDIIFSSLNRTNILTLLSKFFYKESKIVIREPNMPSKELENLPFMTRVLTQKLYRLANLVIAQTDEMRNEIIEYFDGLGEKDVITIHNPIDKMYINRMMKDNESPYLHLSKKTKVVITVGSLIRRKGLDVLLKAFQKSLLKDDNKILYILGKGIEENTLKEQTKQLGISEKVVFHGFEQNPFIYLKFADLFVLSSRLEGLPNVVLESLYVKTPVVITNCVPYVSNLVLESKMGKVVDIDNIDNMSEEIDNVLNTPSCSKGSYEQNNYNFNDLFRNI